MVSLKSVEKQLKRIHFNTNAWGKAETRELTNILLPDEEIYECVNGIYEGGFALLCATNIRLLLVDKKPFNYLTVEDLRFDMINEIDYSHRMLGARIGVSTGSKNLKFKSYNQPRLRKLIGHVQHCMAEYKQQQNQQAQTSQQHLEKINEQLQAYLFAQHEQQQSLRKQLNEAQSDTTVSNSAPQPQPIKPSPQLSDYLFAQTLLKQYREQENNASQPASISAVARPAQLNQVTVSQNDGYQMLDAQESDMYDEGVREVFGKRLTQPTELAPAIAMQKEQVPSTTNPLEINALRIAYSKLPMALRNRRFGRPSLFHAHVPNQVATPQPSQQTVAAQ